MIYKYNGEKLMNMAAIDIGTNSCRLLVARVYVNPFRRSHLRIHQCPVQWKAIDSFCRVVKLGEGLTKTGSLSDKAIERTLDTLRICYKKICYYRVNHLKIVATEACRRANNTQRLIEQARSLFNISIDVISGQQEALYALLGCCEIINWRKPYMLVFDIGGGSTEIVWIKLDTDKRNSYLMSDFYEVIDSISLPYGVVTVNDNLQGYKTKEEIYQHVYERVYNDLKAFVAKNKIADCPDAQMIGSSGTVTAYAAVHLGLETYDRRRVDGLKVQTKDLTKLCKNINEFNLVDPDVEISSARRKDLMNVGGGILNGIFDAVPIEELTVGDRGVREGIIVKLIQEKIISQFEVMPPRAHTPTKQVVIT